MCYGQIRIIREKLVGCKTEALGIMEYMEDAALFT